MAHLRLVLRQFSKNPGSSLVAMLTLGLGIAAATVVFSLTKALVLDPFPYPTKDRIVFVWSDDGQPLSPPDFLDLREQSKSFEAFGVYQQRRMNLGTEHPESAYAVSCTAGVLRALGVAPAQGRLLTPDDEKDGATPVAVISHSLWQRALGGDPGAVGRTVRLDGRETTIVGIMPRDFEFVSPWHDGHDRELWVPYAFPRTLDRGSHFLLGMALLKPGVTVAAATGDVRAIGRALAERYPETNQRKPFMVRTLWSEMTRRTLKPTLLLSGAVTLLVLVSCANVAGLLLTRSAERQGEFGLRLALGASRGDIIRQVLTESLFLAAASAVLGGLLAFWGLDLLRQAIPPLLTTEARRAAIALDPLVLAFSGGLAALTALVFGTLPAITSAGVPMLATIKEGGRNVAGSRSRSRWLRYLLVAQVMVALVLAHGAVLLSASYVKVASDNMALDQDTVVVAGLVLRGERYNSPEARAAFWRQLFERVHGVAGVEHVAVTSRLPLVGVNSFNFLVDDQPFDISIERPLAEQSQITSEYFDAMGIPLVRGRVPVEADARGEVLGVAVNRALAEKIWPGQDPIGRRIRGNAADPWFKAAVVGVVGDVRQTDLEVPADPEVYFPYASRTRAEMTLVVRATGDARAVVPELQRQINAIDPELAIGSPRTLRQVVESKMATRRLLTWLGNGFTVAALLLAMVGIYATLSYTLLQRRREIGIRIALGAVPSQILRFMLTQTGAWALAGVVAGLVGALVASLLLRSLVYEVSPFDPWSLLGAVVAIALMVVGASIVPTLRATRVNPIDALRNE